MGACASSEEVLRGFLAELGRALADPPPIGEIERRICGLGQEMSLLVGDPARNESLTGVMEGLGNDGCLTGVMEGLGNDGSLLLRDRAGHLHRIYSGEMES